MKILLTGATGFFGKNFLEQYEDAHLISAPTHKQLNLLDNAAISGFFSRNYFDVVLHLASSEKPEKKLTESDNFIMYKNIQRAVIVNRIPRLIVIGSGEEYDINWNISGAIEEEIGFNIPDNPVGVSRYLINMLAAKDKVTTNLRHFAVYGKYASPYTNIISKLAYLAATNRDIIIEKDRLVSVIYIDDSLKVINAAVDGIIPKNDYNVVCGQSYKLSQLAKYIKDISGNNINIEVLSKEKDFEYTASNQRLLSAMPSLKFTGIKKGLTGLYTWMDYEAYNFNEKKIKL